jgi:hypothetical protein
MACPNTSAEKTGEGCATSHRRRVIGTYMHLMTCPLDEDWM